MNEKRNKWEASWRKFDSFVEKYGDGDGERWFKEDFTILSLIEDHVIGAL